MICDPPYEDLLVGVVRSVLFNKGIKENGGIFCHTQGWAVMAEAMLGHGDRAYEYFRAYMPAAYNTRAEVREIEPYVYCQSTHSRYSRRMGFRACRGSAARPPGRITRPRSTSWASGPTTMGSASTPAFHVPGGR